MWLFLRLLWRRPALPPATPVAPRIAVATNVSTPLPACPAWPSPAIGLRQVLSLSLFLAAAIWLGTQGTPARLLPAMPEVALPPLALPHDDPAPAPEVADGVEDVLPAQAEAPPAPAPAAVEPAAPAAPSLPFLPAWVQPTSGTRIWAGPEAQAPSLRAVAAGESLRVLGAQRNRLQVEYAGNQGWVNVWEVAPAPAPGHWLRSSTQLWLLPSLLSNVPFRSLPAASLLHVERENASQGTAHVHAYDQDGRSIADGWVSLQDLQRVDPPAWAIKPRQLQVGVNLQKLFGSNDAFIAQVGAAAAEVSATTGIPASVTVAQAILESSWGQSRLARDANNYFGIKAHTSIGPAGLVWMPTTEVLNGQQVRVLDVFRAYHDPGESIRDHHRFLLEQPRYKQALAAVSDPAEFVRRVAAAGYSTDPNYPSKLMALIWQNNLTRFDRPGVGGDSAAGVG